MSHLGMQSKCHFISIWLFYLIGAVRVSEASDFHRRLLGLPTSSLLPNANVLILSVAPLTRARLETVWWKGWGSQRWCPRLSSAQAGRPGRSPRQVRKGAPESCRPPRVPKPWFTCLLAEDGPQASLFPGNVVVGRTHESLGARHFSETSPMPGLRLAMSLVLFLR